MTDEKKIAVELPHGHWGTISELLREYAGDALERADNELSDEVMACREELDAAYRAAKGGQ